MRHFRNFWVLAWTLLGLLAISGVLLTLGRTDNESNPDAGSFGPSGLSAYAEILRKEGFRVRSERGLSARIDPKALIVAFFVPQPRSGFEALDSETPRNRPESPFVSILRRHLKSGGRVLVSALPIGFVDATRRAESSVVGVTDWIEAEESGKDQTSIAVSGQDSDGTEEVYQDLPWLYDQGLYVRSDEEASFGLECFPAEAGWLGFVPNGIGATNRFLARNDNADFWVRNVRSLAPSGSEIVFLESAHGAVEEPGLVPAIGAWAQAAWWQTLILALVVVFTLGKRFGLPSHPRGVEMGSKDLADALSSIMRRGKASTLAVEVLLKRIDREILWKLKLPADSPKQARDERLPDSLKAALRDAEIMAKERGPSGVAFSTVRRLESEVRSFLGSGPDFR